MLAGGGRGKSRDKKIGQVKKKKKYIRWIHGEEKRLFQSMGTIKKARPYQNNS